MTADFPQPHPMPNAIDPKAIDPSEIAERLAAYGLDGLLTYATEHDLIAGYERLGDDLILQHGRSTVRFPEGHARTYLRSLIRSHAQRTGQLPPVP